MNDKSMKLLLVNMPMPWALVTLNGSISHCSYGFTKLFSIRHAEEMKMSVFDFIEPQYVTATYRSEIVLALGTLKSLNSFCYL
jgi:hypothetical protein